MRYTLDIELDGVPISDDSAKILALYIRGLSTKEIEDVTFIRDKIIYNKISDLYAIFKCPKGISVLMYMALCSGFDFDCHVNGIDVLTPVERRRMQQSVPRLAKEHRQPAIRVIEKK